MVVAGRFVLSSRGRARRGLMPSVETERGSVYTDGISPLVVVPKQVVQAPDGCLVAEAAVGSLVIVVMDPGW